jgi:hypothetical protein
MKSNGSLYVHSSSISSISKRTFGGTLRFVSSTQDQPETSLIQAWLAWREVNANDLSCQLLYWINSDGTTHFRIRMFIAKVNRPDTRSSANIEDTLDRRVRQVGRAQTELVAKSKQEQIMLQI